MGCCSSCASSSSPDGVPVLSALKRRLVAIPPSEYPPPAPPSSRKAQMYPLTFSRRNFITKIPKNALHAPLSELATYLTRRCTTDVECVFAIFTFIASLNVDAIKEDPEGSKLEGTVIAYLMRMQKKLINRAGLFQELARCACIPCVSINGLCKNSEYEPGQQLNPTDLLSQWNAVFIDDQWRLIDTLWASTCLVGQRSRNWAIVSVDGEGVSGMEKAEIGQQRSTYEDFYFLTDPDKFICTHLPDKPEWQLLPTNISTVQFTDFVYTREEFFKLGLCMMEGSHQNLDLHSFDGEIKMCFGLSNDNAAKLQFRYLLFSSGLKAGKNKLSNIVMYEKRDGYIQFTVWFPVAGNFRFDIFGGDNKDDERLDLVCSYILHCTKPREDFTGLPDTPAIGWGPGPEAREAGLEALTHTEALISTTDGNITIKFRLKDELAMRFCVKGGNGDLKETDLQKYVMMWAAGGELVIDARLPKKGQYALMLYAAQSDHEGPIPNVCNYLIRHSGQRQTDTCYPRVHEGVLGRQVYYSNRLHVNPDSLYGGLIEVTSPTLALTFASDDDETEILADVHNINLGNIYSGHGISASRTGRITSFNLSLPTPGEYGVNVFAQRQESLPMLYLLHRFLVRYQGGTDVPVAQSVHQVSQIIRTGREHAQVRIPSTQGPCVAYFQWDLAQIPMFCNHVTTHSEGSEEVFKADLPLFGSYTLTLYKPHENGLLQHVASFHLLRSEDEDDAQDAAVNINVPQTTDENKRTWAFGEKTGKLLLGPRLKMAMVSGSHDLLEVAVQRIIDRGHTGCNEDLDRAKKKLEYLRAEKELASAMASGNGTKLELAIAKAEALGIEKQLGLRMIIARRVFHEKIKEKIRKMDQGTIAEMKSYQAPPKMVHSVMQASFMLLGQEKDSKEWDTLRILIGDTNKMKAKLKDQTPGSIPNAIAEKAKKILEGIDRSQIHYVSEVAEAFFAWSTNILKLKEQENTVSSS